MSNKWKDKHKDSVFYIAVDSSVDLADVIDDTVIHETPEEALESYINYHDELPEFIVTLTVTNIFKPVRIG